MATIHALRYREKSRELYEAAASASTVQLRDQLARIAHQYELLAASIEIAASIENLRDPGHPAPA